MNKRRLLSVCLSRMGMLPLLRQLDKQKPTLKILAYHRVMDIDESNYLFDEHLVDSSVADFDRQMNYLSKNYRVLPLSEAYTEFLKTEDPNIVAVTFDDGFNDLFFNVFPIVKKYNIRPTMFLTTGLIGTESTLWTEEIVYLFKSSIGKSVDLDFSNQGESVLIGEENLPVLIKNTLLTLKRMPDEQRLKVCNKIKQQLGEDEISYPESKMLTWGMAKNMADWGVEFGSHSVRHSILTKLSYEDMLKELTVSKEQLEQQLGQSCKTLAYPVGGYGSFDDSVLKSAQEAGYSIACSYLSGIVRLDDNNAYDLRRLHIDSTVDFNWFKGILSCPEYLAANFIKD